jgi:hypothetical protein
MFANKNIPDAIDTADKNALNSWADKFDVTKVKLRAAINAVGNNAVDVEKHLLKHHTNDTRQSLPMAKRSGRRNAK